VGNGEDLRLTVISYGKDLIDYIYGNAIYVSEGEQTDGGAGGFIQRPDQNPNHGATIYAQTILLSAGIDISKIQVKLATGDSIYGIYPDAVTVSMKLYRGLPSDSNPTLMATAEKTITNKFNDGGFQFADFVLSTQVTLDADIVYFFTLTVDDWAMYDSADHSIGYTFGPMYYAEPATEPPISNISTEEMTFKLFSGGVETDATFNSYDPSDMVRDTVDGYGGLVRYTDDSIEDTGYSLDYRFITAAALDIIAKARELAPANWYWYVDPATGILYFRETSTTPDHVFTLGQHLLEFNFDATIEYIKNVVYFTGGPTAGVNLLKKYTDLGSLASNRVGMQKLYDNRITEADEPSAASISDSFMDENSDEVFTADPIVISGETYDTSTIKNGDTVKLAGFANFIEGILFQVTEVRPIGGDMEVTFGKIPAKSDAYVDELRRRLDSEQTLDNPNTPS
jgi:hypothetical protein